MDILTANFIKFLENLSVSQKTLKNYKSDITHFTAWIILKVKSLGSSAENLSEAVPFINSNSASEYKAFLIKNNYPAKTINRRLSTLRHFAQSLIKFELLDFNFTDSITNLPLSQPSPAKSFIVQFEKHLNNQKISKNTLKNYLSDIRQFLTWIEKQNLTEA